MRIAMVGGGYVGLVSGACFAEFGTDVSVVETDPAKLKAVHSGHMPIYEPGLDQLVAKNVEASRLRFTDDLSSALDGDQTVFIAVGTPTRRGDGHADLSGSPHSPRRKMPRRRARNNRTIPATGLPISWRRASALTRAMRLGARRVAAGGGLPHDRVREGIRGMCSGGGWP
jgi:UDPglucose 6-dehydrogenase